MCMKSFAIAAGTKRLFGLGLATLAVSALLAGGDPVAAKTSEADSTTSAALQDLVAALLGTGTSAAPRRAGFANHMQAGDPTLLFEGAPQFGVLSNVARLENPKFGRIGMGEVIDRVRQTNDDTLIVVEDPRPFRIGDQIAIVQADQ